LGRWRSPSAAVAGHAPLYPKEGSFWDFFHEGRLEVAMLCGSVFLLIVGAGGYSLMSNNRVGSPARVTSAAVERPHSNSRSIQGR
jgi:hypothetical protein